MCKIVVTDQRPTETMAPVVVADELPKGPKYVSAGGGGFTCATASSPVTCSYPGAIAVGQTATLAVAVAVAIRITATDGSRLTNVATMVGARTPMEVRSGGVRRRRGRAPKHGGAGSNDNGSGSADGGEGGEAGGLLPDTGDPPFGSCWQAWSALLRGVLVTRSRRSDIARRQ